MKKLFAYALISFCLATQCSERNKSQDNNDNSPACTSSCCLRSNKSGSDSKKSSPTNATQQAQAAVSAIADTKKIDSLEDDEPAYLPCKNKPFCDLCALAVPVIQVGAAAGTHEPFDWKIKK